MKPGFYLVNYSILNNNIIGIAKILSVDRQRRLVTFLGPYNYHTGVNPHPLKAPISDLSVLCEVSEGDFKNILLTARS